MIIPILIFIATIIIAPLTFYLLSHKYYNYKHLKKFPTQLTDKYGDTIFLPLYNATLAQTIITTQHQVNIIILITSILLAALFTIIYSTYQIRSEYVDWSIPKKGTYNVGGYYHMLYMLLQTSAIIYGVINFYSTLLIWLGIIGYLVLVLMQLIKEKQL